MILFLQCICFNASRFLQIHRHELSGHDCFEFFDRIHFFALLLKVLKPCCCRYSQVDGDK
ncbi:hypothetical protein PsorP6_016435 [Peronosclerospora sorghi]|uniref:Uncharacterized protein n=1 Tax=Peronosclerospora sorghi TaxID=230839 RepID=A0ACC0VMY1_9STRA|nr:hypothetical protein PsorP6_016435 [Peronosclerospora sorghi]